MRDRSGGKGEGIFAKPKENICTLKYDKLQLVNRLTMIEYMFA